MSRALFQAVATLSIALLAALPADGEEDLLGAAREVEARFTRVIERVRPSVVSIVARGPAPAGGGAVRVGGGSGVVIEPNGHVLTNDHVVGWAEEVTVIFAGSRRVPARILGRDPEGDLALLRLEGEAPEARVELGTSDDLKLGQWVLAMGNPRGTAMDGRALVTWGTITSLHALGGGTGRLLFYGDAIQTDAEINPGNSGGPLFDLEGRLIGVNGRIATLSRTASGGVNANVGFAVPASQIRRFLPLLEKGKKIRHGYLGITAETAGEGEVVAGFVMPGSSADRAGIRAGDLLIALDGEKIATPARLTNLVSSRPAGSGSPSGCDGTVPSGSSSPVSNPARSSRDDPRRAVDPTLVPADRSRAPRRGGRPSRRLPARLRGPRRRPRRPAPAGVRRRGRRGTDRAHLVRRLVARHGGLPLLPRRGPEEGEVRARDAATGVTAVLLEETAGAGIAPRAADLDAGEPVAVAGHPFGTLRGQGGAAVALGILAQVRRTDFGDRYLLTSAVNPGEFGGSSRTGPGALPGSCSVGGIPLTGFSTAVPVSTLRNSFKDDEEVGAALAAAADAPPSVAGAWPVHDRLKAVAESVCPTVLSLVEEVAEGSDDKPRVVTALLVDGEGHAVTTRANLRGIRTFRAVFPDGREFPADRKGEDVRLGIVMVRVEGEALPSPPVLSDDLPPPGSFVVALGNPNGRDRRSGCLLTMGIVGARNRSARAQGPMQYRALHTDAGVNRGNLGGPLIDLSGRVVGVLSSLGGASLTEVGANSGVGFAISTRLLAPRLDALRRGERIEFRPGYLGVSLSFTPAENGGVLVTATQPNRPAARSGVEPNDVIVAADGEAIAAYEDLRRLFSEFEEGQKILLSVRRGENVVELEVTLGAWPGR